MKHLLVVLILTATAYADAPKEVAAPDVAKFLEFFDKIVDATVADKDQCDKMAADLNTIIDANKDVIAMANKAKADGKTLPADARKHIADGVNKMVPATQSCQSNEKVKTAFGRLDLKKK